jgi:hypothetical protein
MPGFKHILFPVHLSDLHPLEIQRVYRLSQHWDAKLSLVHVHHWLPMMVNEDLLGLGGGYDPLVRIPKPQEQILLENLQKVCPEISWDLKQCLITEGEWSEGIQAALQHSQADVVVTFHRPQQGWFEWLWNTEKEDWEALNIPVLWLPDGTSNSQ